ncbi:glycosyltransferase family 4 protein [Flavobacterium degerlachei]|jgi:glycosyltransferase involved in cell wall biosynthesis|uniref:Glycosyltransferase involved in cell wall bisynthesis n=1 Tax=Flavobacterium degerlachei TaxID=229203 RepID=A0A1H2VWP5_9FLAO|nr:glycosyltransferase family 4 protein [Flavobacterium degerlachei]SDW72723.1 Glycosyltransferase involved in cell wall bisynthesis [Flavobacterium degerlachei]
MKIAFLTPEYPHARTGNSGGIGTSIKNLAKGLLAEGCQVRILVYGQKEDAVFDDAGICIQQIRNVKVKGLSWFFSRKKIEKIINTLYRSKEIDVVEAPDWTGISSFIKPKQCPIVIRLNGSDTYFCNLDKRAVKWKNKFHEKRALQNADALLSVSQFTADKTNEVFSLDKKFRIIPNSIDVGSFNNSDGLEESPNTILYFGSLIRKKGLLELPFIFNEVIKENPAAQLVLVGKDVPDIISGSTSTWEMIKQLFTKEALQHVNYLGGVPYAEIQTHINEATVCVFPSFAEALPVSWIEAMAMQKSIVASNIGWATDVIDDGVNGFLVHPQDHVEYASKINILLSNSQMREEFGIAAREKVIGKFSISVVAQQSLAFYKSLRK